MIAQQPNNAQPSLTPDPVIRGSTLPNPIETGGISVCPRVDWVHATGPETLSATLVDWLESMNLDPLTGDPEPHESSSGFFGYASARMWSGKTGPKVLWGTTSTNPTAFVQLPGSFLSRFSLLEHADMIDQLIQIGITNFSRLDLALDYQTNNEHHPITFHTEAHQSCNLGHLVKPKLFDTRNPKTNNLESQGFTLYLGSRQSESYTRIYDKGQETGEKPPGTWVRWEHETKGSKSHQIAYQLAKAQPAELPMLVQGLVLASASFDPEPEWFKALKHNVQLVHVGSLRDESTWNGFKDNAQRMLGNRLATIAHQNGVSVSEVCRVLFGHIEPAPPSRIDDVLRGSVVDFT
jgi:uncharacterized DUF497 family protein